MVATLATLKLRLLKNSLAKEPWRLILTILGSLYGLMMVFLLLAGAVVMREQPVADLALLTVTAGSVLALGWALIPLFAFGVDDSLDPQRFVLFTRPTRGLAVGLVVAGAISLPGVFTAFALLAATPVWARFPPAVVGWLIGSLLGLATCVLMSRVTTAAAASRLRSRRGRDLMAILGALVFLPLILLPQAMQSLDGGTVLDALHDVAAVLGWSPLGAGWAIAADLAHGAWLIALLRGLVALAWLGALFWWWQRLLRHVMESPPSAAVPARRRGRGQFPPRLLTAVGMSAPAAAVAGRAARYWRTDPRYITSAVSVVILGPVIVVLFGGPGSFTSPFVLLVAPLAAALAGWLVHNDTAHDSTAWWMHVAAGIPGRMDRAGRAVAALIWMLPLVVALSLGVCALTGRWSALPAVLGASLGLLLAGVAVSMYASAIVVYPVQPPGANPFSTSSMGAVGLTMVAQALTSLATFVLALPASVLGLLGVLLAPGWGWGALGVGLLGGGVMVAFSVHVSGRRLDSSQARHLAAMRGWSGH